MVENKAVPLTVDAIQEDVETKDRLALLDETQLYHNYRRDPSKHTLRVIGAVTLLSRLEGVDYESAELLKIAALFHDIEYPNGSFGHEERSAAIATDSLKRLGFDSNGITTVQSAILATHGTFYNGVFVVNPESLEERIICDADMNAVGLEPTVFLEINDLLRQELRVVDVKKWNQGQLLFLEGIQWHTQAAARLWEPQRAANAQAIKGLLSS